jgi:hypothetical protein
MDALTLPPAPSHFPQRHGLNCGNGDRNRAGCTLRVMLDRASRRCLPSDVLLAPADRAPAERERLGRGAARECSIPCGGMSLQAAILFCGCAEEGV